MCVQYLFCLLFCMRGLRMTCICVWGSLRSRRSGSFIPTQTYRLHVEQNTYCTTHQADFQSMTGTINVNLIQSAPSLSILHSTITHSSSFRSHAVKVFSSLCVIVACLSRLRGGLLKKLHCSALPHGAFKCPLLSSDTAVAT